MEDIISCMTEAELDSIEIRLRRKMEDLLSEGDIIGADNTEESIKSLDYVPLCDYNRIPNIQLRQLDRYGKMITPAHFL